MQGLDITSPAPRVNFGLLSQYIGKRVTLVGKVEGVDGNTMRLKAADDGIVTVQLTNIAPQATFIEVEGIVNSPSSITEESCCAFGENFDMHNYNELCKLANSQAYRHMFLP